MMQLDYTFERQLELEREEGRAEGREEGRAEGREEGREAGRAEGREEGQQILADVLMRLQKGETAEELMAAGIDEKTVQLALEIHPQKKVQNL